MSLFRRAIRLLFLVIGFIFGVATTIALFFFRMITNPPRQNLWATPRQLGVAYDNIQFPAQDGVRISGWFIPAKEHKEKAATLILIPGWPWNRLGTSASRMNDLPGSSPIDLLPLIHTLHHQGYHILTFDLRNHGESGTQRPVTFGLQESQDLLGALAYLHSRPEVDPQRIGTIGFSIGANTTLFALPQTDQIKAAVLVQPTSPKIYIRRYALDLIGPLSYLVLPLTELFYYLYTGLQLNSIDPTFAATGSGKTPVLYIQGVGDHWGSIENVAQMVSVTPNAIEPILIDSTNHYDGYQELIKKPEDLLQFLKEYL